MTTKTSRFWAIGALVTLATGLTACLKSSDVQPEEPAAYFYFTNATSAVPGIDFFDNDVELTTSSGLAFLTSPTYKGSVGAHTFKVKKINADSLLASSTNVYDSLDFTSLFIYDLPTYATGIREVVEDYSSASSTKINVRFFNLSVDAPAVDVYLDNIKIDSAHAYERNGNNFYPVFKQINTSNTSNIKLTKAGTDSTVAEMTASLGAGYIYTIYLAGRAANTNDRKLKVNYYRH